MPQDVTVIDDTNVADAKAGVGKEDHRKTQCLPNGTPKEKRYPFEITYKTGSGTIATHKDCFSQGDAKKAAKGAFEKCVEQCKGKGVGVFEPDTVTQAAQAAGSGGVPGQCGQSQDGKFIGVCGGDTKKAGDEKKDETPRDRYFQIERTDPAYRKKDDEVLKQMDARSADRGVRDAMEHAGDQFIQNKEAVAARAEELGRQLGEAEKDRADYLKARDAYPNVHDDFEKSFIERDYARERNSVKQAYMRGRLCASRPEAGYSFCQ